jgi:hypothetical protein
MHRIKSFSIIFIIFFCCLINIISLFAQNDCADQLTIDPVPPLCIPAAPIQLNANFTGTNPFSIEWSPSTGLSSSTILNPLATITGPITYTLTVKTEIGDNLVVNGDFEMGNTGFTSAYAYSPANLVPEGVYAVTTNPGALHPGFPNCSDMSGGGNMMSINGANTPNIQVWCQTITVDPDTEYNFSAWVSNIITQSPAQLQFSANGQLLGPTFSATGTCNWQRFDATWYSGGNNSVTICIVNQNTAQSGNDFNLDNIEFRKVCSYQSTITIEVFESVEEEVHVEICYGESWFAGGAQQTTSGIYEDFYLLPNGCDSIVITNLTVLPQIPDIIIDTIICEGEVLEFDGGIYADEGIHEIIYQSVDGCDSIVIIQLAIASFDLSVGSTPFLNCFFPDGQLEVLSTGQHPFLWYEWATINGNIVSNNWSSVVIDQPGSYQVNVYYQNGNVICGETTLYFEVEADFTVPDIVLETIGDFECGSASMQLTGINTTGGSDFQWNILSGGDIVGNTNTETITINGPGVYQFVVTNSISQCTAAQSIEIEGDPSGMNEIIIQHNGPLTCDNQTVVIDAGNSVIANDFFLEWYTENGNIISGEGTSAITVDQPGSYFLILKDNSGSCADTTPVQIDIDTLSLSITMSEIDLLTCAVDTVGVMITVMPEGDYFATWFDDMGTLLQEGANLNTYETGITGNYAVLVTNQQNGCTSELSFTVVEDVTPPDADAGPSFNITCTQDTIQLQGSSDPQSPYLYIWQTTTGEIISGGDSLMPVVVLPGEYILVVQDTINGCIAQFQTDVIDQRDLPEVIINPTDTFTCDLQEIQLSGIDSEFGQDYSALWTHSGMTEIIDRDSLVAVAQAPGIYTLTITNYLTGCVNTGQVEIAADTILPLVSVGNDTVFNCQVTEIMLDGNASAGGVLFSLNWTTVNGNIISGGTTLTPTINSPGVYILTAQNTKNGCFATDSMSVLPDKDTPEIVFTTPDTLNCAIQTVLVNATGSSSGSQYQYFWGTLNGQITNILPPLTIEAGAPGTYTLEIFNTDNQCRALAEVQVFQDIEPPAVETGSDLVINCNNPTVTPETEGSSTGSNFQYEWTTADGIILSGINDLTPVLGGSGTYNLIITNLQNFCSSSNSVEVVVDTLHPDLIFPAIDPLTCVDSLRSLDGTALVNGDTKTYLWFTDTGNITTSPESSVIQVSSPGIYSVHIRDTVNGCEKTFQVEVLENRAYPLVVVNTSGVLSCTDTTVSLESSGSSSGGDFEFEWTASTGETLSSDQGDDIEVMEGGWYILTIQNTLNGCVSQDSVLVEENVIPPFAFAGADQQLTCSVEQVTLTGSGSAQGNDFSVQWILPDNTQGPTTSSINTSLTGTYTFWVTNLTNGCISSDQTTVLPNEDDITGFIGDLIQPDCFRNTGRLFISGVAGGSAPYRFAIDGQPFSEVMNFDLLAPGFHVIYIEDINGCFYEEAIEVLDIIPVEVTLPAVHYLELGESIVLIPELNIDEMDVMEINWTPQDYLDCPTCLQPLVSPVSSMDYTIYVKDIHGCLANATTHIFLNTNGGIFIPSAFSPGNADEINDRFTVFAREGLVRNIDYLEVFDRWGNQVFMARDFLPNDESQGWDGSFRSQEIIPGVFVYSTMIELVNGEKVRLYGEVTLYR